MFPKVTLLVAALVLVLTAGGTNAQSAAPDVSALVRQSDFIGFVQTQMGGSGWQGNWRQSIEINSADPVKGALERDPTRKNQYPWIKADPVVSTAYPAWFGNTGEYLVFLRPDLHSREHERTANAVYPVVYHPEALGQVVGRVGSMEVSTLCVLLTRVVAGEGGAAQLSAVLVQAAPPRMMRHHLIAHDELMRETELLAASILPGTTRADVQNIFPWPDAGLMSSGEGRYYLGADVMVAVPYTQTGGAWSNKNTVSGPLKVYASGFHSN